MKIAYSWLSAPFSSDREKDKERKNRRIIHFSRNKKSAERNSTRKWRYKSWTLWSFYFSVHYMRFCRGLWWKQLTLQTEKGGVTAYSAVIYATFFIATKHHIDIRGKAERRRWYKEAFIDFKNCSASVIGALCALRPIFLCSLRYRIMRREQSRVRDSSIMILLRWDRCIWQRCTCYCEKIACCNFKNMWGEENMLRGASVPFSIHDSLNYSYNMTDCGKGRSFLHHPCSAEYQKVVADNSLTPYRILWVKRNWGSAWKRRISQWILFENYIPCRWLAYSWYRIRASTD